MCPVTQSVIPWGTYKETPVFLYEISNPSGLSLSVCEYGGILQSLRFLDAFGTMRDLVLGYDNLFDYQNDNNCLGASIGPIADLVVNGQTILDNRKIRLQQNTNGHCLHSGPAGFHKKLWQGTSIPDGVCLNALFSEEETGLPGHLDASITYRILSGDSFQILFSAVCDKETALSFTNHSFFHLAPPTYNQTGIKSALSSINGHFLQIYSDYYESLDKNGLPSGNYFPVNESSLDFTRPRALCEVLFPLSSMLYTSGGIDHFFPIPGIGLRPMAELSSPDTGLRLTCFSDMPGLLVYTANNLPSIKGKQKIIYNRHTAICLEPQAPPNAVNVPSQRNLVLLQSGQVYHREIRYVLSRFSPDRNTEL
ncbi:aldose epimerase family protein [Fusibacillus kribbianus]|uniref:Aldose epimerase family protein n=1 Tax=Fusibacillus kribbianus TaxID=3044208 RepID=A0AAP4BDE8_9FIRM|nr:aldose epimerase family protein [Ruminococcus sp. YH-rum2234]MDI9243293.1 aldose epimerase family protein [Ruminococcus sp. YH-rum2234]